MAAISSLQNTHIKLVRGLMEQPKLRRSQCLFVAEGTRLLEDGLKSGVPCEFLLYREEHSKRTSEFLASLPPTLSVSSVENRVFDGIAGTESPQGVLGVFEIPQLPFPEHPDFLLILDRLRDPGNLGTILRSAEAAGVQAVLLSPESSDAFSPKVVRSGMGVHFRLPIQAWDWAAIKAAATGLRVFCADMQGHLPYWQANFRQPLALLMGSEAEGIGAEGLAIADQTVRIPMSGETESLNAAISTGIILFEVLRQRSAA